MVTWCWQTGCFRTTERKHYDRLEFKKTVITLSGKSDGVFYVR